MLVENDGHVLVVEREIEFKDRIRGQTIVRGASSNYKKLGLYERLSEKCAHDQPLDEHDRNGTSARSTYYNAAIAPAAYLA
jgi:hypothetical protein